jgi:hypothetical protein
MAYTNIDDPSAYFQIAEYTGNSSSNSATNTGNVNLQPDFIWGKCRSTTKSHYLYDSSRGQKKDLYLIPLQQKPITQMELQPLIQMVLI